MVSAKSCGNVLEIKGSRRLLVVSKAHGVHFWFDILEFIQLPSLHMYISWTIYLSHHSVADSPPARRKEKEDARTDPKASLAGPPTPALQPTPRTSEHS